MKIKVGDEVRDTITGFSGVVVCRSEWMFGCVRITVQPRELKDGKPVDYVSFDEDQLEVLSASKQKEVPVTGSFDRPNIPRAREDRR